MSRHAEFGFDDLKHILVDRIGVDAADIEDDPAAKFDELGLDSLAFMEFQAALREEYGIQIDDDDAVQMSTIGDTLEYVNARLAEMEPRS